MTEPRIDAPPTLRLALPAKAENVAVVRQALAGLAAELGAPRDLVDDIKTAVSEAATNVVAHAYPGDEPGPLEICAFAGGRHLEVIVRDAGVGIKPRPIEPDGDSLRVGLALIGAVADRFEISGQAGGGTEVKISFDLYRGADTAEGGPEIQWAPEEGAAQIAVRGSEPGGAAIPKVLEMMVARSGLSLDHLADAQLLGDFLADWNAESTIDARPLELTVSDLGGALELRVGPLEPGFAQRMLDRSEVPGLGRTLERVATAVSVEKNETPEGEAEFLILEIDGDR